MTKRIKRMVGREISPGVVFHVSKDVKPETIEALREMAAHVQRTMGQLPKIGQRVLLTGGGWRGYTGEYRGPEQTLTGTLHRVELDNGMASLVTALQMRVLEDE